MKMFLFKLDKVVKLFGILVGLIIVIAWLACL